ncbi:MAG: CpsD/CapB family tyrosine-protein kinase [Terriglobales bacterium]
MSRIYEALRRSEERPNDAAPGPSGWAATLAIASPDRPPEAAPEPIFSAALPRPAEASRLVCWTQWESPQAEAFRQLAARLLHLRERCRQERHLQSLVCASSAPQEGKSLVAANLALALARTCGRRVLLLEGDLRRPVQARLWGIEDATGLAEWIAAPGPIAPPPVLRLGDTSAYLLPAGAVNHATQPLAFLESSRAAQLLLLLNGWFEWVLIDAPPLLPVADGYAWARLADGLLLVTRAGVSRKAQVREALRHLESRNLVGVVVNQSTEPVPTYPPRA